MTSSKNPLPSVSFEQIAEVYRRELRRGKAPSIEKLAAAFPHVADRIRAELVSLGTNETTSTVQAPKSLCADVSLELKIGSEFAGYVVERELRRHENEANYLVRHSDSDDAVILKLARTKDPISVNRRDVISQCLASQDHPNIAKFVDKGDAEGKSYFALEKINGSSLTEMLSGGGDESCQKHFHMLQSDCRELAKFGIAVASALQHLHDRGFPHCAIDTQSLMLDCFGKPWISDFCLWVERSNNERDSINSDVNALGNVLYLLATGKEFSEGCEGQQQFPSNFPPELCEYILRACLVDSPNRFKSAAEFAGRLLETISDKQISAKKTQSVQNTSHILPSSSAARNLRMLASGVGAAFVLTTLLLLYVSPGREQATPKSEPAPTAVHLVSLAGTETHEELKSFDDSENGEQVEKAKEAEPLKQEVSSLRSLSDIEPALLERFVVPGDDVESSDEEERNDGLVQYPGVRLSEKIMEISLLVERSQLPFEAQKHAVRLLKGYAAAAISGAITAEEGYMTLNQLTGGLPVNADTIADIQIEDFHLRNWFAGVERRMSTLPPALMESPEQIVERVTRTLGQLN